MARAIVVQAGPLASSAANKVALIQKAAVSGTNYIVLNGGAGSFTANSICASQTPSGPGPLTINGTLATTDPVAGAGGTAAAGSATVRFPTPVRIYITGGSDESGKTFRVVGTVQSPTTFGPGIVVSEVITGPNASTASSVNAYSTIISITASAATAGAITVGHYGTATLDTARRVLFTDGGNDSGITATITGGDWAGDTISETVTLTSGSTVATVLDYLTITSITTSGAVATTLTVGTNGVAGSQWARLDEYAAMGSTSIQVDGSGTVNWTVQQTLNDPTGTANIVAPANIHWVNHPDSSLVGSTTTSGVQGNYAYPPKFARILLNSETGSGYVTMTIMQNYQK